MNRVLGTASALLILLLVLVPAALAADPVAGGETVVVSVHGDMTFPAGQRASMLVVVEGTATIEGDVGTILVLEGSAKLVGSHTGAVVAFGGNVSLDDATTITGDVLAIGATMTRAAGATVQGHIGQGIDVPRILAWAGPVLLLAYLALVVIALAVALFLAGVAPRQVRSAEAVLRMEAPVAFVTLVAALIATLGLSILAMVTILGMPLGFLLLMAGLPLLALAGFAMASIWIGELVLGQATPGHRTERPYRAAVVGVLITGAVSFIPPVGAVVSIVGAGPIVLLLWRAFRTPSAAAERGAEAAVAAAAT